MDTERRRRRQNREAIRTAALLLGGLFGLQQWREGPHLTGAVVAQLGLVGLLLFDALVYLRRRPESSTAMRVSLVVMTAVTFTLLVQSHGGPRGALFGFFPLMPLLFSVLMPMSSRAGLTMGVLSLGCGTWLLVDAGMPDDFRRQWWEMQLTATLFAMGGMKTLQRLRERERDALQAETRMQAQLAESERRRSQSERLALVGRLAAGVAHEVNNPLSYVKANLQWLQGELALRGEGGEDVAPDAELAQVFLETIGGTDRIAQIVNDLRSFARDSPAQLEEVPVKLAVEEALRLASMRLQHLPVQLSLPDAPEPLLLLGQQRHLVQVLVNLLVNAAEALEGVSAARIEVKVTAEPSWVELRVEDNGPGLSEEQAARLFEPFFTTKPVGKGTGLGLALSREYVVRAGGSLEARPRPGGGAVFQVRWPRSVPPRPASPG
jgi:C4-dicarboxylate-specific signal transduction histidine kinase